MLIVVFLFFLSFWESFLCVYLTVLDSLVITVSLVFCLDCLSHTYSSLQSEELLPEFSLGLVLGDMNSLDLFL